MGMVCNLLGLTPAQMSALQGSPSLVDPVTTVAQADAGDRRFAEHIATLPPDKRQEAETRKREMELRPEMKAVHAERDQARIKLSDFMPFEAALDLDKSWHILHYLMTGQFGLDGASDISDGLLGGDDIGDDLVGYGPARLLDAASTKRFAEFLRMQDAQTMKSRVNHEEMMRLRVYGVPWGAGNVSESEVQMRDLDVGVYFPRLREYVLSMAANGNGLLIWLT
jgi:hypothetical protein